MLEASPRAVDRGCAKPGLLSEWADVVISNGVVNLCPDKRAVFEEMHRVLKPGGRIQIGDIIVQEAVPNSAKEDVDLWTG